MVFFTPCTGVLTIKQLEAIDVDEDLNPRRWINAEEKGKDVAAVWGTEFNPFLAMLVVLH